MAKIKRSITEGPIFFRIMLFALPIMLTGILQLCYNMADSIIVGNWSGDPDALAAVGSTAALNNLIVNLLIGIAGGTSVVVAQFFGAENERSVSRTVHTAISFSLIGGLIFAIIGFIVTEPALVLMDTKPEILDKATLYLRIICIGIPALSVYNFGAGILRAVGDSKTPLIILASSGLINVGCNLLFVIGFKMAVDGVATATVISQYISAIAVVSVLMLRRGECYRFSFKKLCFDKGIFLRILRFGVPAGIQGSMFSISNVLITTAANTFPTTTITAKTIAGQIDGVTYTAMNCFFHASMTFSGQNYGARKYKRIGKVLLYSLIQVAVVGIAVGQLELVFGRQLASIFIEGADPNKEIIIDTVIQIMSVLLTTYFLCGIQEVLTGTLRGMGYSLSPMIISLVGICGLRIIWIYVFFPMEVFNSIQGLMLSYPITWVFTIAALSVNLVIGWRKLRCMKDEKSSAKSEKAFSVEERAYTESAADEKCENAATNA